MPQQAFHTEQVEPSLTKATEPLAVFVEHIDQDHANPPKSWKEMGEPKHRSDYKVDSRKAIFELDKEPLGRIYERAVVGLR